MCWHAGSQLFVHGGRNNFVLEDMFVLDLARKEWTDVAPGAHTPPPRHGHLMAVHADKLYMYGGYDELGAWSDAMFCLPVPYDQPFTAARSALKLPMLSSCAEDPPIEFKQAVEPSCYIPAIYLLVLRQWLSGRYDSP